MKRQSVFISMITILTCIMVIMKVDHAVSQSTTIAPEEYLGEVVIPEAIKGFDEKKVKKDPICDSSTRPEIKDVKPDTVRSGDKIIITGSFFGKKKECLHSITIGSEVGKNATYINDKKVEVTVPDSVHPGMTFVNVQSGGGAARSAILITGQE